jgi:hypothetical protein
VGVDVEGQHVELLDVGIVLQDLLQQFHADIEAIRMFAQRRVEQEDCVRRERSGRLCFQLRVDARVDVLRKIFSLPAGDGLHHWSVREAKDSIPFGSIVPLPDFVELD